MDQYGLEPIYLICRNSSQYFPQNRKMDRVEVHCRDEKWVYTHHYYSKLYFDYYTEELEIKNDDENLKCEDPSNDEIFCDLKSIDGEILNTDGIGRIPQGNGNFEFFCRDIDSQPDAITLYCNGNGAVWADYSFYADSKLSERDYRLHCKTKCFLETLKEHYAEALRRHKGRKGERILFFTKHDGPFDDGDFIVPRCPEGHKVFRGDRDKFMKDLTIQCDAGRWRIVFEDGFLRKGIGLDSLWCKEMPCDIRDLEAQGASIIRPKIRRIFSQTEQVEFACPNESLLTFIATCNDEEWHVKNGPNSTTTTEFCPTAPSQNEDGDCSLLPFDPIASFGGAVTANSIKGLPDGQRTEAICKIGGKKLAVICLKNALYVPERTVQIDPVGLRRICEENCSFVELAGQLKRLRIGLWGLDCEGDGECDLKCETGLRFKRPGDKVGVVCRGNKWALKTNGEEEILGEVEGVLCEEPEGIGCGRFLGGKGEMKVKAAKEDYVEYCRRGGGLGRDGFCDL